MDVDVDSDAAALLGSAEDVLDVTASAVPEEGLPTAASGTDESARSRLSMLSSRSVANLWMANCRAAVVSRAVRSWRLRYSATLRRYLS